MKHEREKEQENKIKQNEPVEGPRTGQQKDQATQRQRSSGDERISEERKGPGARNY